MLARQTQGVGAPKSTPKQTVTGTVQARGVGLGIIDSGFRALSQATGRAARKENQRNIDNVPSTGPRALGVSVSTHPAALEGG